MTDNETPELNKTALKAAAVHLDQIADEILKASKHLPDKYMPRGRQLEQWAIRIRAETAIIHHQLDLDADVTELGYVQSKARAALRTAGSGVFVLAAVVQSFGVDVPDAVQASYEAAQQGRDAMVEMLAEEEHPHPITEEFWDQVIQEINASNGDITARFVFDQNQTGTGLFERTVTLQAETVGPLPEMRVSAMSHHSGEVTLLAQPISQGDFMTEPLKFPAADPLTIASALQELADNFPI